VRFCVCVRLCVCSRSCSSASTSAAECAIGTTYYMSVFLCVCSCVCVCAKSLNNIIVQAAKEGQAGNEIKQVLNVGKKNKHGFTSPNPIFTQLEICNESPCEFRKQFFHLIEEDLKKCVKKGQLSFVQYVRDKFPSQRELVNSGLGGVVQTLLSEESREGPMTVALNQIMHFAKTGTVSPAMCKLQSIVSSSASTTDNRVVYYPGAHLDLRQVLIMMSNTNGGISSTLNGAAVGSLDADILVCVSSFEISTLQNNHKVPTPNTNDFIRLIGVELSGSLVVKSSRLVSDSRHDASCNTPESHADTQSDCPVLRLEWEINLRNPRTGPGALPLRLVYYVNEDFESFWPRELRNAHAGCLDVLYSMRNFLPMWNQKWTKELEDRMRPASHDTSSPGAAHGIVLGATQSLVISDSQYFMVPQWLGQSAVGLRLDERQINRVICMF